MARQANAQSGPSLTIAIIARANGGGAPGQTLQAGVFSVINNLNFGQSVSSVTIAFSNPSMFSSATLTPPPSFSSYPGGTTASPSITSPPASSTTFTFNPAIEIGPGSQPAFALTVKLSPLSRNEAGKIAYAGMTARDGLRGAGAALSIVFAMLGVAMAALPGGTRRRAWLLAGLMILLAAGAPGCGGDSPSGPSSTQTVTAVAVASARFDVNFSASPPAGLPLKLGTITGQ